LGQSVYVLLEESLSGKKKKVVIITCDGALDVFKGHAERGLSWL
jgi:hypothetical protein